MGLIEVGRVFRNVAFQINRGEVFESLTPLGPPRFASVSETIGRGDTLLHASVRKGKTETVQRLLRNGANKDEMNDEMRTPLYLAAALGRMDVALALLAAGADVNLRCGFEKRTTVHIAAVEGHVGILRKVLKHEHGADVDAADVQQCTALHLAARHCIGKVEEVIKVLIEAGANVEAPCGMNVVTLHFTPLHLAVGELRLGAALALLKHGASVNARASGSNTTSLHLAARLAGAQEPRTAMLAAKVAMWLAAVVDNNHRAAAVDMVLGWSGMKQVGAAALVDLLLRWGAEEEIVNISGNTAMDVVGLGVIAGNHRTEDAVRVRELLANARVDKAWRRRGYLVLCRGRLNGLLSAATTGVAEAEGGESIAVAIPCACLEFVMQHILSVCLSHLASAAVLALTGRLLLWWLRVLPGWWLREEGALFSLAQVPVLHWALMRVLPRRLSHVVWMSTAVWTVLPVKESLVVRLIWFGLMLALEKAFRVYSMLELLFGRAHPNSGARMYVGYISMSAVSTLLPVLALSTLVLQMLLWAAFAFRLGWEEASTRALVFLWRPSSTMRTYAEVANISFVSACFWGFHDDYVASLLLIVLSLYVAWYSQLAQPNNREAQMVGDVRLDVLGITVAVMLVMILNVCVFFYVLWTWGSVWLHLLKNMLLPGLVLMFFGAWFRFSALGSVLLGAWFRARPNSSTHADTTGTERFAAASDDVERGTIADDVDDVERGTIAAAAAASLASTAGDMTEPTGVQEESFAGDWAWATVRLGQDDIFRKIVGYL